MESTLGDLRKYLGHRIGPVFKFQTGVVKNVSSVGGEFVVQKEINEIHLANDIDKVPNFQSEKAERIQAMSSSVSLEILDNGFNGFIFLLLAEHGFLQVSDQHGNLSILRYFPKVTRQVKEEYLQAKEKSNPLVPPMVLDLRVVRKISDRGDARMGHVSTLLSSPSKNSISHFIQGVPTSFSEIRILKFFGKTRLKRLLV